MRYPPGHKDETRRRILDAAGTVFRRQGYHAGGVDQVMREAGLTAGGFYAHFPSKEALFAETLPHALRQTRTLMEAGTEEGPSGADWLQTVAARYLSPAHRRLVEKGCPLPALLPEVARATEQSRQAFQEVLEEAIANIAARGEQDADEAFALLGLLVGGLTLARAVADEALGDRILAGCRKHVEATIERPLKKDKRSTGKPRTRRKKGEPKP
jgi:TetR/AcrR family transcriptional repressor of nem operon